MSLIKCFECNAKVSEFAERCPQCGCPIDAIKKEKTNRYLIRLKDGQIIDLTGIEQQLTEEELKLSRDLADVLNYVYGLDGPTRMIIKSMFEFNDWKFPQNYQDLYDAMCEYNQQEIEKKEANKPKCPICGSTNIGPLSTFERLLGAFSMGRSRLSWVRVECKDCGHMW